MKVKLVGQPCSGSPGSVRTWFSGKLNVYPAPVPGIDMDKRTLFANLLLVALGVVGVFHTVLAFAFDTGLRSVGLLVVGLSAVGVLLLNVAAP